MFIFHVGVLLFAYGMIIQNKKITTESMLKIPFLSGGSDSY